MSGKNNFPIDTKIGIVCVRPWKKKVRCREQGLYSKALQVLWHDKYIICWRTIVSTWMEVRHSGRWKDIREIAKLCPFAFGCGRPICPHFYAPLTSIKAPALRPLIKLQHLIVWVSKNRKKILQFLLMDCCPVCVRLCAPKYSWCSTGFTSCSIPCTFHYFSYSFRKFAGIQQVFSKTPGHQQFRIFSWFSHLPYFCRILFSTHDKDIHMPLSNPNTRSSRFNYFL